MRTNVINQLTAPAGGAPLKLVSVAKMTEHEIIEGVVFSPQGGLYRIQDGILNLLPHGTGSLSLAQMSNLWGLVARGYEWPWRIHSLRLMSREIIDIKHERSIFHEMLGQIEGALWLDLAASTALYGRWLAPQLTPQGGEVISLDLASPMLQQAQQRARKEGVDHISFVIGRGEHLPFADNSLDGVVCGGSLNEFGPKGVIPVLRDVARALRKGGVALFMHLLTAERHLGSYAQHYLARPGGIAFWRREETDHLFKQAGFVIEEKRDFGVVAFTRLRLP